MKQVIFFLLLLSVNVVFAQTGKLAPPPSCPYGMCIGGSSIAIDVLNFHKPRTNCLSGFGFCIRFSSSYFCTACNSYRAPASLRDNKVSFWFTTKDRKAELHLPLALKTARGFETQDMTTFTIDDNSFSLINGDTKAENWIRGGTYPVVVKDEEYVITVDIL